MNHENPEEGCTTEVHALDAGDVSDEVRKDCNECQENGAGQCDSGQYLIYIHHGGLSGADAGDEAAVFLHVICQVLDIHGNGGIEIGEDKNEETVADGIWPGAPSKEITDGLDPAYVDELCQGNGKHENGGCEDDGDDTGLVHFQRQVGGMAAIHSASDHTLGVLDRDSSLSFIHFDDHEDHGKGDDQEQEKLEGGNGADLEVIHHGGNSLREAGYDTAEDDKGNTVADTMFRNLIADPHEEAGACCEDNDNKKEIQPAVINKGIVDTQGIGHAECLHSCQENGEVSCYFLDFLVSFCAVFSPFFQGGDDSGEELHNDG